MSIDTIIIEIFFNTLKFVINYFTLFLALRFYTFNTYVTINTWNFLNNIFKIKYSSIFFSSYKRYFQIYISY